MNDYLRRVFVIENLPWFFVIGGIIAPIIFFIIAGFTLDTEWHPLFIVSTYVPYAIASTVLFGANVAFVKRDMRHGELPTAWLVALMYATFYFALLLWAATILILVNNFYLHSEGSFITRQIGFALIGSGLAGDGIAALVAIIGFKKHLLGRRIHPWIWSRRR